LNPSSQSNSSKLECTGEKEAKKNLQSSGNIKVLCRFRPFDEKEKENSKL